MSKMDRIYEGSVKTVYRDAQDPRLNYFYFSDDYSIFDWGKMPDTIMHKGKVLSILGGLMFEALARPDTWQMLPTSSALQPFSLNFINRIFDSEASRRLSQTGLAHHCHGLVDTHGTRIPFDTLSAITDPPFMKVTAIDVTRPRAFTLDHHTLYQYDSSEKTASQPFLIPLEVIFRFGMPGGSSLEGRLAKNPAYAYELGLSSPPEKNVMFERPVIEFFTKLEPQDRFLPVQEAFLISGLAEQQFTNLYETATLVSLWLFERFAQKGIELWDGKLEFAWSPQGLMLVDSIGPDELRLIYQGVHLSKELIRQFYRNTPWEKAVQEAKQISQSQPGSDWRKICTEQLQSTPQPFSAEQRELVDSLYGSILNHFMGETVVQVPLTLTDLVSRMNPQPVGV